jgi:hypothetical protein
VHSGQSTTSYTKHQPTFPKQLAADPPADPQHHTANHERTCAQCALSGDNDRETQLSQSCSVPARSAGMGREILLPVGSATSQRAQREGCRKR